MPRAYLMEDTRQPISDGAERVMVGGVDGGGAMIHGDKLASVRRLCSKKLRWARIAFIGASSSSARPESFASLFVRRSGCAFWNASTEVPMRAMRPAGA